MLRLVLQWLRILLSIRNLLLCIIRGASRRAGGNPSDKIAFAVESVYTVFSISCILMKNIDSIEVFLLRCFAALMTERSVSRAADALETSQPALSKALARLRILFADPLLIRARGHMVPTDRALELEEPVQRILADLAGVMEAPRGFDPHNAEATFRFTSTETAERLIFPRLLARLQDVAPRVRIEARHPSRDHALRWLETGEIDFRLGWLEKPPPTLRSAQLYRDHLVCVARKDHPVIRGHISLEQFMQHAHARLEVAPHGMSGRVIDEAVARAGGKLHVAMLAQNYGAVLNTVAQSNLIAMVSERMLKSNRNPLALQVLEPPLKLPEMRVNLFWHERTHKDPRHRWFRQLITSVAREI